MKITEKELEKLNFEKVVVPIEESGMEYPYYYYTYELIGQNDCLISNCNDEAKDVNYKINIFTMEECGSLTEIEDVKLLLDLFKKMSENLNK